MKNLIIPCAGRSSRFPDMKPKWLLTYPDGKLMIEKCISGLNIDIFDKIIITIVKQHIDKHEAETILNQVFENYSNVEICILDDFTSSVSETIYTTIKKLNIKGSIVIKDSDNYVKTTIPNEIVNTVLYYDIYKHPEITNIAEKSFILMNSQNMISDIIEKRIVSGMICIGIYMFSDTDLFTKTYEKIISKGISGEIYLSHIISYILSKKYDYFQAIEADCYEDWGTIKEWKQVQKKLSTYFIDVDGILIKNSGKYGTINWNNNKELLDKNISRIKKLQQEGAQIIITTSRPKEYKNILLEILNNAEIYPDEIIMDLYHSQRIIINDFAPTNPYPSCIAINIPRNKNLEEYL